MNVQTQTLSNVPQFKRACLIIAQYSIKNTDVDYTVQYSIKNTDVDYTVSWKKSVLVLL